MSATSGWGLRAAGTGAAACGVVLSLAVLGVTATGPARAAGSGAPLGAGCRVGVSNGGTVLPAAVSPTAGSAGEARLSGVVRLDGEQVGNARVVAGVARGFGLPVQAAAVGLMAAMQESSLRNVDRGDVAGPDSRGLFQQRPVFYPGVDPRDPVQASTAFFRRLQAVTGWQLMPMWQAAQAVQRSADGRLYARWARFGVRLAGALYGTPVAGAGVECDGGSGVAVSAEAGERVRAVLSAAGSRLGSPYVWGGGDARGPTEGVDGVKPPGFDCSGLMVYAFARIGVGVPHSSQALYEVGRRVPLELVRPGDMVFLSSDGGPGGIHHVAMVWQPGQIIEAQDFGVPVHVRAYRGAAEPQILPDAVRVIV